MLELPLMNILILNWKDIKNPLVGGAEVIAYEYARRLVKDGHTVTFFTSHFNNASKEEMVDGVRIIRKGNRITTYFFAFFYYLSLSPKPDRVVDMVNTICYQTPLYVPKKRRVMYVNQLAKEVFYYELPWYLSYFCYFLERFEYLLYRNTKTLCYSKSTKNDLISFGIKKNRIKTFSLGLDHSRYVTKGKKSPDPLFVFCARLVKMKRADLCIRSMKPVALRYPEATLVIIGNGPDEERLEKLVKKLRLEKNVFFVNKNNFYLDKNTKDIKVTLMQRAWALILPSAKEGWGMVVTEAAACGTPSIVSDVTGLRDSTIHRKSGLILSSNPSAEELSASMIKIIEDKKLRMNLSHGALLWCKNFNWDKSYNQFKSLLLSSQ